MVGSIRLEPLIPYPPLISEYYTSSRKVYRMEGRDERTIVRDVGTHLLYLRRLLD